MDSQAQGGPERHLLRLAHHDADRIRWLLGVAAEAKQAPDRFAGALAGRTVGTLARTEGSRARLVFGVAAARLGAQALFVSGRDLGVDPERDPAAAARLLGATVDQVVASLPSSDAVAGLARASRVPVINGGTADHHPCRALADVLALRERLMQLAGRKLAWVGPSGPVLGSLLVVAPAVGLDLAIAGQPHPDALAEGQRRADEAGTLVQVVELADEAIAAADAVYRDGTLTLPGSSEAASLADAPDRNRVPVAMAVMLWLAGAV